ncbi:MAG TPA: DUF4878 domain-containing protein [Bacteroidia bacterium]|nr:DUF4878 domain-containing protein [Bacteroidia bacterium]
MKTLRIELLIAFFGMLISLNGCSGGNKPSAVASSFLSAVNDKNYEAARKYATPETGKLIDLMEQLQKMSTATDSIAPVDFEVVSEKIDGDKAVVTFKEKGSDDSQTINLIKSNDKWLVSLSKQDLAAKNTQKNEEGESGIFGDPSDTLDVADTTTVSQSL